MPFAEEGLLDIGEYIALDNPARAISFIDELTSSLIKTLSTFPRSAPVAEDLGLSEEIRVYSYGNYNCYYRVIDTDEAIEVLYIFNASRDVQALISGH